MLILSRKRNQGIVIGDGPNAPRVIVVDIRGDKVRLGIAAEADVTIDRDEVRAAKDRELLKDDGQEVGKDAGTDAETAGKVLS